MLSICDRDRRLRLVIELQHQLRAASSRVDHRGASAVLERTTTSSSASGVNPNQRETLPPGDIPDTIAYVPYSVPGAG